MEYKDILFFIIFSIAIFLTKLLIAFITLKLGKENTKLAEIFHYKGEFADSITVSLLVTIGQVIVNKYFIHYEMLGFLFVAFILSLIVSYYFLAIPLRTLFEKEQYGKNKILEDILRRDGFSYNIRLIKGNISNAFATGIFPYTKTILIGKLLYENMSHEELKAVIYHEIGHIQEGHLRKMYFLNLSASVFFVFIMAIRGYFLSHYNFINTFIEPISIILTTMLYASVIFIFIPRIFYRKMEFEADRFGARKIGKEIYIQMLNKLNSLSGGRMVKGDIAHPTLAKRIENVQKTVSKNIMA